MMLLPARSVLSRTALVALFFVSTASFGLDQPLGQHGRDHDKWHGAFYQQLRIPGSQTSCCNLADCRPTQVRTNGDHYEIMKDGRWITVEPGKIVRVTAPDGGAHICAPETENTRFDPDYVFCIVMPLES
jgi:hypothetical protein